MRVWVQRHQRPRHAIDPAEGVFNRPQRRSAPLRASRQGAAFYSKSVIGVRKKEAAPASDRLSEVGAPPNACFVWGGRRFATLRIFADDLIGEGAWTAWWRWRPS
ncbi:protein of unknown function (plasmid) [Caballeronia sp. S22]